MGALLPSYAHAQLQNTDFEQWDYPHTNSFNNPTGWKCVNRGWGTDLVTYGYKFAWLPDTAAQQNDYALTLSVWYNYTKDAALQVAPISSRPTALTGYYKYADNIISDGGIAVTDTAQIWIMLTKWNSTLAKNDTVGIGMKEIFQQQLTFRSFEVNVNYLSSQQPDSVTVFIDPSMVARANKTYQHVGGGSASCSYLTVDNLSLINGNPTAIRDTKATEEFVLYPNPARDRINFEARTADGVIMDITGKTVSRFSLQQEHYLDVSHLSPGTYFILANGKEGMIRGRFIKQ